MTAPLPCPKCGHPWSDHDWHGCHREYTALGDSYWCDCNRRPPKNHAPQSEQPQS